MPQLSKPLTYDQAFAKAKETLAKSNPKDDLVVMLDKTITKEYGWVFFYNTRQYLETKNIKYVRPGTAPFIVNKNDGTVYFLPSSKPVEAALEDYEKELAKH
jgi:hypothetical protein